MNPCKPPQAKPSSNFDNSQRREGVRQRSSARFCRLGLMSSVSFPGTVVCVMGGVDGGFDGGRPLESRFNGEGLGWRLFLLVR